MGPEFNGFPESGLDQMTKQWFYQVQKAMWPTSVPEDTWYVCFFWNHDYFNIYLDTCSLGSALSGEGQ